MAKWLGKRPAYPMFDRVFVAVFSTLCLLVAYTFQQHTSVSQGQICSDKCMSCHIELEVIRSNFVSHPVTVY